jgi:two-component system nitrogen regulation sensor histidine kinase NtrY
MLLMLALTVFGVVAAVGWTGSVRVRHVFEFLDRQQTDTLVGQFQHEFNQRGADTAEAVSRMAASDALRRMAFDLANGGDSAPYLTVAVPLAQEYRLDYLEIVGHDGSIISSLQWTARFGYKEPAIAAAGKPAFLKQEDVPDGSSQIGLFAVRAVNGSDAPLFVVGGRQLDAGFLRDFPVPAGTQLLIYRNVSGPFDAHNFAGATQGVDTAEHFRALVDDARTNGRNAEGVVYVTPRQEDSLSVTAIPLTGAGGDVLAVLVVANSRRSMVEVQRHIRDIAYGIAGLGIIFARGGELVDCGAHFAAD